RSAHALFQRKTCHLHLSHRSHRDTLPGARLEGALKDSVRNDDHLQASREACERPQGVSGSRKGERSKSSPYHSPMPPGPREERSARRLLVRHQDEGISSPPRRRHHFIGARGLKTAATKNGIAASSSQRGLKTAATESLSECLRRLKPAPTKAIARL